MTLTKVSGSILKDPLNLGEVSIGGTLTYEDVTNVDSVGLITARSGINVTGGILNITNSENTLGILSSTDSGANIDLFDDDTQTRIRTVDGNLNLYADMGNSVSDSAIRFFVDGANEANEKVRITSDGKIGINSAAPNTRLDVIAGSANRTWTPGSSVVSMFERSGHCRVGLVANATSYSQIDFGDTNDDNAGYIKYDHNDDSMSFRTAVSERLRIASDGVITGRGELRLTEGTSSVSNGDEIGSLMFTYPSNDNKNAKIVALQNAGTSGADLAFFTRTHGDGTNNDGGEERLRITSTGLVGLDNSSPQGQLHIGSSVGTSNREAIIILNNGGATGQEAGIEWRYENITTPRAKIHLDSSGQDLRFATANTERLRIHSTGYITKPYQVAFFAHCSFGNHDLGGGDKFQFNILTSSGKAAVDSNHHTFGGTAVFNTSTNTFTAPVAGLYSFTVGAYFRRTGDSITHLVPRVNNTEVSNGNNNIFFFGSNDITDGLQLCGTVYLQLAANDAVTIHRRGTQTGTTRFYGPHSHFCGHLIG